MSDPHSPLSIPELTEPVEPLSSTAGAILSAKRQEWGFTVQEVASTLNLSIDTIDALEADDFDRLPGTTFIKGYIRSYARLLKLDAESLMGTIDLQPERITEIPSTRAALRQKGKTRSREKSAGGLGKLFRLILILLVLATIAIAAITQLPKLGISNLSDLMTLPSLQEEEDGNEILIPETSDSNTSESQQADQPKGALIRIE